MLIEFRVKNHRSLRDEQVLTMEAGLMSTSEDVRPRQVAVNSQPLLTVVALYGANASGKSNVLHALRYMRDSVLYSDRAWEKLGDVPRNQFSFDAPQNPTLCEMTFECKN